VLALCAALYWQAISSAQIAFAIGFAVLLLLDRAALAAGAIDRRYWRMRCIVSAVVIGCLLVVAYVPSGTIGIG